MEDLILKCASGDGTKMYVFYKEKQDFFHIKTIDSDGVVVLDINREQAAQLRDHLTEALNKLK